MDKIAVISDSGSVRDTIKEGLEELDYTVLIIVNNKRGLLKLIFEKPDVIIVDINTLLKEGYRLVSELASNERIDRARIFIITSEDKLRKLDNINEIDDFILAPLSIPELDLRIRKALRKEKPVYSEKTIESDGLVINPTSFKVTVEGMPVEMTYKEFELLKLLVSNSGRAFSRASLLRTVWGYDYIEDTRTVDNHIKNIRSRIGSKYASKIKTVRKVGYRFDHQ